MKFQEGESVIILDTLNKPAGIARIISYNNHSTLYAVSFRYPGASSDEEFEVPAQRLLKNVDFVDSRFIAQSFSK